VIEAGATGGSPGMFQHLAANGYNASPQVYQKILGELDR